MAWMADLVGVQDMNRAHAEAYLKSVYGDDFRPPKRRNMKLAGGSIGDRYEDRKSLPLFPKSSVGPWILASACILALAGGGMAWFWSLAAKPITTPLPTVQPAAGRTEYINVKVIPGGAG